MEQEKDRYLVSAVQQVYLFVFVPVLIDVAYSFAKIIMPAVWPTRGAKVAVEKQMSKASAYMGVAKIVETID